MKPGVDYSSHASPPDKTSPQESASPAGKQEESRWKRFVSSLVRPRVLIGLVLCIVVIAAIAVKMIFFSAKGTPAETPPVVTVSIVPASYQSIDHFLEVTGSVSAWDPLSIGAEINGLKIAEINVEEGDRVKSGQVMAVLNSSVLRAQLDQARARLVSSRNSLKKAIQPNRHEDIETYKAALSQAKANTAQQEAMLAQAEANMANAERNEKRFADLVKQGAVSQSDYETRLTTAKTTLAEVNHMKESVRAANFAWEQAKERLAMALIGGRREDVDISRAAVAENEATVKQLEAQVEQTIIRAPTDALVIKRDAHIGDITAMNKSLFTLMRNNRLELRAQVPETDLLKVKPGEPVKLLSYADNFLPVTGSVRVISPLVDTESRLGTVRIDVPSDSAVKPGMFLRGIVDLGKRQALTVPSSAVFNRDGQSFVFVLSGTQARRRIVTTGAMAAGNVEILSGIKPGDPVIADGGGFLKDGDCVRVSR
jgi:HlyD family secretion protein